MLEAHLQALEMVDDYVSDGLPLTTSFIKEVHALITRAQETYEARDALGRPLPAALTHGKFKTLPNHVVRADGSRLEFAPPSQVDVEIERLVEWFNEIGDTHPVVAGAWLHHRFIQVHPFQDGNGRVARALTHLAAARWNYTPLVVERLDRSPYLHALDTANGGNLVPLIRLFIGLTSRVLLGRVETPTPQPTGEVDRPQPTQGLVDSATPQIGEL